MSYEPEDWREEICLQDHYDQDTITTAEDDGTLDDLYQAAYDHEQDTAYANAEYWRLTTR